MSDDLRMNQQALMQLMGGHAGPGLGGVRGGFDPAQIRQRLMAHQAPPSVPPPPPPMGGGSLPQMQARLQGLQGNMAAQQRQQIAGLQTSMGAPPSGFKPQLPGADPAPSPQGNLMAQANAMRDQYRAANPAPPSPPMMNAAQAAPTQPPAVPMMKPRPGQNWRG